MWRLAERAKQRLNGKITENTPVSFFKLTGVFLGVGVGQHKGQLGGGGALAVHPRRGFAHAHRAVLFYQFTVQGLSLIHISQAFAQQYGIPRCYDSYEALAADPEVEAIYVATPNTLHYENCKLCFCLLYTSRCV